MNSAVEYWVDACQRTVLTLDVLRERGNEYVEHERSGKPPVLVFDFETVLDAREFDPPANYALVKLKVPAGYPPTDSKKRPFVIIDPRAGHGPGIGGFKIDSEVGIALKHGHPCYCVTFFPQPLPGQTIEAVSHAEVVFLKKVNELHEHAEGKPFVIGNCQGGWALMMLASVAPQIVGPILLAGSPISYWAGVVGKNPMRYSGGLLGGTWMASLAGDLGNGKFDGAYLVNNFEQMNPSNTYWTKLYNLYSKIDTEGERFLGFEKWWGGHFLMNKEEMDWIAQNLFVGNKLSAGQIESADGRHRVDIRNIRSPIVVFASWGDDITPPQQALNWIADVYSSVDEIRNNEQTIVYCLHEKIGHLGIFVSAGVARRETAELASALDLIETLPPGLYEARIEDTRPDMPGLEYLQGRYLIQFFPRTIEDVLALDDGRADEHAFEVAKRVSETNQHLYDTYVSPLVQAMSSQSTARAIAMLNPARLERYLFSDFNPWMFWVKSAAETVRANRRPVTVDNPLVKAEHQVSNVIEQSLDNFRDVRDSMSELTFKALYESPGLAALVGLSPKAPHERSAKAPTWEQEELVRLKRIEAESHIEQGTLLDGWVRILMYCARESHVVDERPYNLVRRMIDELKPEVRPSTNELKATVKRQVFVLMLDENRAIAALPKLLPEPGQRRRAMEAARAVARTRGAIEGRQAQRLSHIEKILGVEAPVQKRESA
jgi:pimeloyl-ACP methyl ester carboxylesterase